MLTTFNEIFTVENELREVPSEDGLLYLPTHSVAVKVEKDTYEHPMIFDTAYEAEAFMDKIVARGTVDTEIWFEYEPQESYSNGDFEPYDEEERHYLQ